MGAREAQLASHVRQGRNPASPLLGTCKNQTKQAEALNRWTSAARCLFALDTGKEKSSEWHSLISPCCSSLQINIPSWAHSSHITVSGKASALLQLLYYEQQRKNMRLLRGEALKLVLPLQRCSTHPGARSLNAWANSMEQVTRRHAHAHTWTVKPLRPAEWARL